MEIIETQTNEKIQLKYTPTIKDNGLNWWNIDSQKSVNSNKTIWDSTPFSNKGIAGVYNTITPLSQASYVIVDQQKTEPVLMKMIQASNGEERNIMYIIGNRQFKCMQENGTIRATATSPISAYNSIGLCGKRTTNFSQLITSTYTDEHGDTRYYWQDYGEFTFKGFKWSIKKLLNEFFIKVADELADANIYTPTNTFPYDEARTTTQNILLTTDAEAEGHAGFTIKNKFTTPNNEVLNISEQFQFLFNLSAYRVILYGIRLGYNVTMVINTDVDVCLFRIGKRYSYNQQFTIDDYIGGYGVVTEINEEGVRMLKQQGTPIMGKEVEIKATDEFICIPINAMYPLIEGRNLQGYLPDSATYSNTITNTPYYANDKYIYNYLPDIDILQLLRIYQFVLNKSITIDETVLQTSIIPVSTQMRYYPIISYVQKFDTFGSFKAKNNVIKIEGDDNNEEMTILDVDLSSANITELEDTAEIVTLPNRAYYPDVNVNTHTAKSFTRCYEVVISINYAFFKSNLTFISFFGQKARVLSGQYDNENQTAKLIILI